MIPSHCVLWQSTAQLKEEIETELSYEHIGSCINTNIMHVSPPK
jgi:hypothetical protein